MPLEAPNLDPRTFDEIARELRLRIPRYTPEWTDFNESDPGITLVELFAWLTETILYQLNRVPEQSYIKFLQLLGMELRPAQPARAYVTFSATPGAPTAPVPVGARVQAQPPAGGDPVVFETEQGLGLVRVPLTDVQVFDGTSFTVVTEANATPGTPFRPLGWVPQVGSALYLGFSQTDPPAVPLPFPDEIRMRVFLPVIGKDPAPYACSPRTSRPPASAVTLIWEYRPQADPSLWQRLAVFEDESSAFTLEDDIQVEGPKDADMTREGRIPEPRFWIRARVVAGSYPAGRAPEVDLIRPNTVGAVALSTVRGEVLGTSEGHPDQSFTLRRKPVQPGSLSLYMEGQEPERWIEVPDFLSSGPQDPHYVVVAGRGEVRFGDGARGRIPEAGVEIVAREYRYGGGAAGNVGPGLIATLLTPVMGVEGVTNERPALGGREEQPLEELKEEAPARLRSRNRAVTREDFAALAQQAGGVARATAIPLAHPDHPGVEVPGALTVVVVPDTEDIPPVPSPQLLQQLCQYLDGYRLLTTEVHVKPPKYRPVTVHARVAAQPYAAFDAVRLKVVKALNDYLAPLPPRPGTGADGPSPDLGTPAPAGWAFGQELYPTSLFSVILGVRDVAAVRTLDVIIDGRPWDSLTDPVPLGPDELVYGTSDHQITVEPLMDV
jgi:predicted phage baseplate assembly protein